MTANGPLPPAVRQVLQATIGEPVSHERLGGMGQGRVYHARSANRTVIVKRTGAVEDYFYRVLVPAWPELRRHTPRLLAAVEAEGQPWLLLEAIPNPLPQARRLADPEVLDVLRSIHTSTFPALPATLALYRPTWDMTATDRALAALPASDAATLARPLDILRRAAQPLFTPRTPLSGDPNPANWGLRDDGSLVLFDWERLCLGTPALDLAITVPGLGDPVAFRLVAAVYATDASSEAIEQLAREIALAKVWSAVEFLAQNAGRGERTEATVAWLAQHLAGWLLPLARDLALV